MLDSEEEEGGGDSGEDTEDEIRRYTPLTYLPQQLAHTVK